MANSRRCLLFSLSIRLLIRRENDFSSTVISSRLYAPCSSVVSCDIHHILFGCLPQSFNRNFFPSLIDAPPVFSLLIKHLISSRRYLSFDPVSPFHSHVPSILETCFFSFISYRFTESIFFFRRPITVERKTLRRIYRSLKRTLKIPITD